MPEMFDEEPEETPAGDEPTAEPDATEEATPQASDQESASQEAASQDAEGAEQGEREDTAQAPGEAPEADAVEPTAEEERVADEATEEEQEPVQAARDTQRSEPRASEQSGEVIPGAHLEPDLVLEEAGDAGSEYGERAGAEIQAAEASFQTDADGEASAGSEQADAPAPRPFLKLAADARYHATGKRKRAVARVIIKPGSGAYIVNGRELGEFFPRPTLQKVARGPLETVGQEERMDVIAKIHGGGVSSQAGALRHGIARALVDADPNLRSELKRRGFLTRDPRVKERKKAGLKKARKRPQFSKR